MVPHNWNFYIFTCVKIDRLTTYFKSSKEINLYICILTLPFHIWLGITQLANIIITGKVGTRTSCFLLGYHLKVDCHYHLFQDLKILGEGSHINFPSVQVIR